MAFQAPAGSRRADEVTPEWWKPETKGEVIAGRVSQIITGGSYSDSVELSPVLLFRAGADGDTQGFHSLRCSINASLDRYRASLSGHVAIKFVGYVPTKGGNMRKFKVLLLDADQWRDMQNEYAPDAPFDAEPDDDDTPF